MSSVHVGSIRVEVTGEGDPVVMVHGLGGTSNTFQPQMSVLAGFRVIRPDLPGSGRSPPPCQAPSIESFTADLARVCDALGVSRGHFVGHSMGTLICQHLAVRHPGRVATLSLFGPLFEPPEPARAALRERAGLARSEGMVPVAEAIVQAATSSDTKSRLPAVTTFVRESLMRQDAESYALGCEALAGAHAADLRLIDCPVLLVTGDDDMVTPPGMAEVIARRCRDAAVQILPHCGHWTTLERVEQCNAALRAFLGRHRI